MVAAIGTGMCVWCVAVPAYFSPEAGSIEDAHEAGTCMKISMLSVCAAIAVVSLFGDRIVTVIGSI